MLDNHGLLNIHSEDIPYYDLQSALSDVEGDVVFELCEDEAKRSFIDAEWITFALMALPAAESAYNIVKIIKNEINKKVMRKMNEIGIKKTVKVSIKINLPFFSYEKCEEIIVNPIAGE